MHDNIHAEIAAQNIFADQTSVVRLLHSAFDLVSCQCQFSTYIDESGHDTAGIASKQHSLNQEMGVLLHQHAVFEGAWFALIAVAAEITWLVVLSEEAPFHTCGETCSAAP